MRILLRGKRVSLSPLPVAAIWMGLALQDELENLAVAHRLKLLEAVGECPGLGGDLAALRAFGATDANRMAPVKRGDFAGVGL